MEETGLPASSALPIQPMADPFPVSMSLDDVQLPAATTSLAAESSADKIYVPTTHLTQGHGPLTAHAITLLIEELRHQDLGTRLHAFRQIPVITNALGPKRTREEFVPYLAEFCDDDDEVLLLLSSQFGEMVESVGGPEFASALLPPLEQLAGTEEQTVRSNSIASIVKIAAQLTDQQLLEWVLPVLRRLATAEWFTSRISASSLFTSLYPRLPDTVRRDVRQWFRDLCRADETPMVKRAATGSLADFVTCIEPKLVYEEMLPVLQRLSKDEQDSVRLLTVHACINVAKIFSKENKALNVTKMGPILKGLISDPSWRVRHMVADKYCELGSALGPSIAQSDAMLDDFVKLLLDPEPEVRTAAAGRVGDVAKLAGEAQTIKKFFKPIGYGKQPQLSVLQQIIVDQDETTAFTRAALSSVLLSVCLVLSPSSIHEYILPIILHLLQDPSSDVRLNLLSKFETLPNLRQLLPLDELSEPILTTINDPDNGLAKNAKWRVRLAVIQLIPTLAKQLGEEWFDARLGETCMAWLGDSVWSIREAATSNLAKLAEAFGREWARRNIIPKVIALGSHKSYLFRMTAVFAISEMAACLGAELTTEKLLPVVVKLANDSVANVRFNSARVLGSLMTSGAIVLPQPLVEHTLSILKQDPDADVKYYAEQALNDINKQE